jgi:hypothetical protein
VATFALVVSSASAAGGSVIPWLSQRPVKAFANPPLASPCRASDLHAHLFMQGATGSLVGGVELRNAGARPCSLLGWPTVSFAGGGATGERWQVKKLAASRAPLDVLADPPGSLRALQPGKSAGVSLFWSNWCGPGATPTGSGGALPGSIVLRLASGTSISIPVAHAPRCDAPQVPSTLSLGPFTPTERHLPESSRLPLRATIVGARPAQIKPGVKGFLVHRGELFRYRVSVTNTGRDTFRFARSSCPVYIEQPDPAPAQVYVLNCRPVDAIAPGGTVVFAMQARIPTKVRLGAGSLTWELAPKTYEAPFTAAPLWVRA